MLATVTMLYWGREGFGKLRRDGEKREGAVVYTPGRKWLCHKNADGATNYCWCIASTHRATLLTCVQLWYNCSLPCKRSLIALPYFSFIPPQHANTSLTEHPCFKLIPPQCEKTYVTDRKSMFWINTSTASVFQINTSPARENLRYLQKIHVLTSYLPSTRKRTLLTEDPCFT